MGGQDDGPLNKRRKVAASGRLMGSTTASRGRQAFGAVNNRQESAAVTNKQDAAVGGAVESGVSEGVEGESVRFSKEEVEALLNEKIKAKKFDLKVYFIGFIYFLYQAP